MTGISRRIAAALTAVLMIMMLYTACCSADVHAETSRSESEGSSFEYKKYPDHTLYRIALKRRMSGVYNELSSSMIDSKTIPIPGLVNTEIYDDGSVSSSEQYVPQGLCRAGDYMLVTAYDVKKKNQTVIYVVDIAKHTLVSTLTLPNKYHAGGIAFDGENIWMTGDTSDKYKGEPFVQYLAYDTFLQLITEPLNEVKSEDMSGFIYIKNKPSFLECDSGRLWVGTYIGSKGTSEAYMNGYKIIGEPGARTLNTVMYPVVSGIDSSAQGADIVGTDLYVSSSYKGTARGVKSSFITKYYLGNAAKEGQDVYVKNREVSRIEVPKMNEEILVDGSAIHINFESGADRWKNAVINTDRILVVKAALWR